MDTKTMAGCVATLVMAGTLVGAAEVSVLREDSRCSLVSVPSIRSDLYFVGTALSDTVQAGPGEVTPSKHPGHWGDGQPRDIYGQLVRIDVLSPDAPAVLRDALERRDSGDVLVVPWDYDAACAATYWTRSARWVGPALEGFYSVRLRSRSLWVGGRPTFDAFYADITPYPHGPFFRAGLRGTDVLRDRASLTAREYFSLHSVLPTSSEVQEGSSQVLARLRAWEKANPELAGRPPADQILERARRRLQGSW